MIIGKEVEASSGAYKSVEEFQNWFCLAYLNSKNEWTCGVRIVHDVSNQTG